MPQYFNAVTGKYEEMTTATGGFASGAGSSTNPVPIAETTVKPKSGGFLSGVNIGELLNGVSNLTTSVGNLFDGTRTNPIYNVGGTAANNQQPQGNNTMLYILGAAVVVIVALIFLKKK